MRVEQTQPGDPAAALLVFYGGVIEIGIDDQGRFVGCKVAGDLFSDEPLLCLGHEGTAGSAVRREIDPRLPLHFLFDDNDRVIGVHIVGRCEAKRVGDLHPALATPEQRREMESRRVRAPIGRWPANREEFEVLIEEIDSELQAQRVPIPARPMRALMSAGRRLKQEIGLTVRESPTGPDSYCGDDFVHHLHEWFRRRYADRLAMPLSPGRFAVELLGDVWEGVLPRVFGVATLFADRAARSDAQPVSRRPVRYNVLDSLSGLTDDLRFRLTNAELKAIFDQAVRASRAYCSLESLKAHDLAIAARSDLSLCASNLTGQQPHHGQARWSALQAVEKVLKLALSIAGIQYDRNHRLGELNEKLPTAGHVQIVDALLQRVTCSPGVRYGEMPSTAVEAMAAHEASLEICAEVGEAICALRGKRGAR